MRRRRKAGRDGQEGGKRGSQEGGGEKKARGLAGKKEGTKEGRMRLNAEEGRSRPYCSTAWGIAAMERREFISQRRQIASDFTLSVCHLLPLTAYLKWVLALTMLFTLPHSKAFSVRSKDVEMTDEWRILQI